MAKKKNVKRVLNIVPSQEVENDWVMDNAVEAGMLAAPAALPASVDLREAWWKIGDQGSTGSCVGWGTGEGVLRWHFARVNRLSNDESLSPRYIWMAAKETDEFVSRPSTFIELDGTSLKSALDIARKFGVVKDNILPFGSGKLFDGDANTFYAIASQLKISSYFNLFKNLSEWRIWLAANGPLLVALNVDKNFYDADQNNGNLDAYIPPTKPAGHCVSIVGYMPDGRFIIRNSWGIDWGDNGFAYASEDYIQAAFYPEAYGVKI